MEGRTIYRGRYVEGRNIYGLEGDMGKGGRSTIEGDMGNGGRSI